MADGVFNIALGRAVEKVSSNPNSIGVLLLTAAEADATLEDHDDVAAMLGAAGNTEASDASYARKTGLTETIDLDDTNDLVDLDIPDQTWAALAGDAIVKAVVFVDEGGTDATRIPISHQDFAVTPDGSDVTIEFDPEGFYRAS